MKKYFAAGFVALLAGLTLAATASADVPRHQPSATLVVSLTDAQPGNQHTFTITWTNPCGPGGSFSGTGSGSPAAGGAHETISGSLVGDHLTFTAIYQDFIPGYTWTYDGPLAGPVALGAGAIGYHASATVTPIDTYKNHGDYVKQNGSDAAHSCIGLPIQNVAMTFTAITPEGAYDQWTNVWTHVYLINYDTFTHAFSGTGWISGTLAGPNVQAETISGVLGSGISFTASYNGTSYAYSFDGPFGTETLATDTLGSSHLDMIVTEPVAVP